MPRLTEIPRIRLTLNLIAAAILAAATGACNTSGCLDNHSAIPLAEFYSSGTGDRISLSGIEISGVDAPNDSILQPATSTAISQIYLPMRSTLTSTEWCIAYTQEQINDPSLNDTLRFEYISTPFFASEECGAMYNYRITSFDHTTHLIDSITLTDSLITNADIVSIKIYFRTDDTSEQ